MNKELSNNGRINRYYLPMLFFLLPASGFCQTAGTQNNEQLIDGMTCLRRQVIENQPEGAVELGALLERLGADRRGDTDPSDLLFNLWYSRVIYKYGAADIKRNLAKYGFPDIDTPDLHTEQQLQILDKSSDLVDLISSQILREKFPYPVNPASGLFAEFQFYGIKNGQRIAEIGAGTGSISVLIGAAFQNTTVYVNEADKRLIAHLNKRLATTACIDSSNHLIVVKGKTKSTGLEGKNLDMIFMRNAFHHFSNRKAMIAAFRKSIKPGGTVFITESVRDLHAGGHICSHALHKAQILDAMQAGHFRLIDEQTLGQKIVMKFEPVSGNTNLH